MAVIVALARGDPGGVVFCIWGCCGDELGLEVLAGMGGG